jgi:hypothetical protein
MPKPVSDIDSSLQNVRSNTNLRRNPMSQVLRLLGIAAVFIGMIGLPVQPVQAADVVLTLAPGQTVTIPLDLWCLDYGEAFPTSIQGPTARPPDEVVKVMQTAIKKGTVTTDIYQTQLAIWRATTGAYQDFAGKGTALAQEIFDEAQSATIAAPPPDAVLVDEAVKAGTLKDTIESFVALPVPGVPGEPFHGQADLVIENVSTQNVKFVLLEGAVFESVGGNAQVLISHQNPPTLPETGGGGWATQGFTVVMPVAVGLMLLLAGTALRRAARCSSRDNRY